MFTFLWQLLVSFIKGMTESLNCLACLTQVSVFVNVGGCYTKVVDDGNSSSFR